MSKPLFKNTKPYVVSVPTPYGGSLSVPPNKYVAGTYFVRVHMQLPVLTPVSPDAPVRPTDIVATFDVAVPTVVPVVTSQPAEVELKDLPQPVEESKVSPEIEEPTKKNKGGRPRKTSLEDATKNMWKSVTFIMPEASDVDKMSKEDLFKLAGKLNVSSKGLEIPELKESLKDRLRNG